MVGEPGTVKRLRVRLRAADRNGLAKTFGSNISASGLYLRSPQLLSVGTPVLLELLYQSGEIALRGRGTVQELSSPSEESGMQLALDWDEETSALARWVVEESGGAAPAVESQQEEDEEDPFSDEDADADADDPFEDVTVFAGDGPPETWIHRIAKEAAAEAEATISEPPVEAPLVATPAAPTPPPPPILPPELSVSPEPAMMVPVMGAAQNASGAWDLISDLIDRPAEAAAPQEPEPQPAEVVRPTSDLERDALADAFDAVDESDDIAYLPVPDTGYAFSNEVSSGEIDASGVREPGEVTPLARIELVRSSPARPIRTSDILPLELPPEDDPPATNAIPSKKARPELPAPSARVMAIDLGTSNARAAIPDPDVEARIIESRRGTESVPSVVTIRESGKTIVGEPALRKVTSHPESSVLDIRRLMGLPFESPLVQTVLDKVDCTLVGGEEGETAVKVGALVVSLEEVAALLLKELRESALMSLEEKVNRVVLTCPIAFGHRQREALLVASKLAGLHVEQLVAEPVAAAVHFAAERGLKKRTLFVYRFGGGTFDATVLRVEGDSYEVLASGGDQLLGGAEMDAALASLLADEVVRSSGLDPRQDPRAMAGVLESVREAKLLLSERERAKVYVEPPFGGEASFRVEVEVSREQAELLWAPLLDRTIHIATEVCERAGIAPRDVDDLILAGGQVAAPVVMERVRALFEKRPVDVDPACAAVLGAAQIAGRLGTDRPFVIKETLSRSIGIWVEGGGHTVVLERDTALPAEGSFLVEPAFAQKGRVELYVSEGEGEEAREPIGLLRIEPVTRALEIRLLASSDGLIRVCAQEDGSALPVRLVTDLRSVQASAADGAASKKDGGLFGWIKKRFKNSRASIEK